MVRTADGLSDCLGLNYTRIRIRICVCILLYMHVHIGLHVHSIYNYLHDGGHGRDVVVQGKQGLAQALDHGVDLGPGVVEGRAEHDKVPAGALIGAARAGVDG